MKMPDPIIEPATIMVESKSPSPRFSVCSASGCRESMSAPVRFGQEGMHKGIEFVGISYVNVVLAFGKYVQPRAGDAAMNRLSVQARRQRILCAVQHQGRALTFGQQRPDRDRRRH